MSKPAVLPTLLALYPFVVFLSLSKFGLAAAAAFLVALSLARLALFRRGPVLDGLLLGVGGLMLGIISFVQSSASGVLLYPVFVNLTLLLVFASSIWKPPTVVERLARIRTPDLSDNGVRYTRGVTAVWCGFFGINGMVSFYTVFYASLETWVLYNGLVSYLLMGLLFLCEWGVRRKMLQRSA